MSLQEVRKDAGPFYDYTHQAWVKDGRYMRCGHAQKCNCYGRVHEGEAADMERILRENRE